jgi:hypothetical protein
MGMRGVVRQPVSGALARLDKVRNKRLWIAALLFLAAIQLQHGAWALQESVELDLRGLAADGTVVAVKDKGADDFTWTDITVTFTDAQGRPRQATQAGRNSTRVGDWLRVTYDPENPGHVRWDGSHDPRTFSLILGGITLGAGAGLGIGTLALALMKARRTLRPKAKKPAST